MKDFDWSNVPLPDMDAPFPTDKTIDEGWLSVAYAIAECSKDPSSQNGAVLLTVDEPAVGNLGFNHFYEGVPTNFDDRTKKLQGIEHAERDAIYTTAKNGGKTEGATLVCPWVACRDCARAILGTGIARVVCHSARMDLTDERWRADIEEALGWLVSAGVIVDYHDGPIAGAPDILVSGRLWSPADLCFRKFGE